MELAFRVALILVGSYLVGAIPFSLLVGKLFYKVDLRLQGSGNLGATNVYRVFGWKAGLSVAILDIAKGSAAVGLAALLTPAEFVSLQQDWLLIVAAMAAVAGHSYSPYIRFKGGKGVATAAGALLFVTPMAWMFLLVTFVSVSLITRYVSLGSICAAVLYPILVTMFYRDRPAVIVAGFAIAAVVLWRHRTNIVRLYRGEESKIRFKKPSSPKEDS
ncbi:MAG: glycerol-3-phosphate 1-O-acyltransferase PlsY [Coriobacteriia bacterium]|nr:glycerol-3-phosphate 1-O-acyltransferase PlsY [Coriobacteriia bacterium]MDO9107579.1 glycerol-3-phosphate 1-O-acyltransferase PlsY [Coriobacteriia bacterium]